MYVYMYLNACCAFFLNKQSARHHKYIKVSNIETQIQDDWPLVERNIFNYKFFISSR